MSAKRTSDYSSENLPDSGGAAARKVYSPPQLTRYGDVQKLTRGSGGTQIDGSGGLSKVT